MEINDMPDLDLPSEMFRSSEKKPVDFPMFMWRVEERGGRNEIIADRITKKFDEIGGRAIFEGDILIAPADIAKNAKAAEQRGLVITGSHFRWPRGKVNYMIADDFLTDKVKLAIEHWKLHTPIEFTEIKPIDVVEGVDYIMFEDQGGCFSAVGRQGGEQTVSLGPGCGVGSAIHEIGHSLGLWHEQGRADRDQFIRIIEDNILQQAKHNFGLHSADGDDIGIYDFGSIMHYPSTAFSKNGQPTIVTLNGESIGQRNGLSRGDIETAKSIYPDVKWNAVQHSFVDGHCTCGHA